MTGKDSLAQRLLYTPFRVGGENRISLFYTPHEQGCGSEGIAGAGPVRLKRLYSVTPRGRVSIVAPDAGSHGVVA